MASGIATNATGNVVDFTCKCGFARRVTDTEIFFRCERPIIFASETHCGYFWQKVNDGTSPGVPVIHRVSQTGVDQADDATVSTGGGGGIVDQAGVTDEFVSDPVAVVAENAVSSGGP